MENEKLTADDLKQKKAPEKAEEKELAQIERLKARAFDDQKKIAILEKQLAEAKEEKRKPGISMTDADGTEKKKRPSENSWGLTDKMLPPCIKGRVAIYKIVNMNEINDATGLAVEPYDVEIPGRYTITDIFETNMLKKKKVIRNVVGTEEKIVGGEAKTTEVVDVITFNKGWLHVPIFDNYPLHVVMELHPNYKYNRYRPSNAPVLFERTDIKFSPASQGANLQLMKDAMIEVDKLSKEDVYQYAAAVPQPNTIPTMGRPLHEIRTDLMRFASQNPIVYFQKMSKNSKAAIHINVLDAMMLGLIDYNIDRKGFVNMESDEVICIHTASEDPMEKLVKHLDSAEGKEWYTHILNRMHHYE